MKNKEYYIQKYEDRMMEIYNEFRDDNIKNMDEFCTRHFDETANAEEVVGYYYTHYGWNPLKHWMENTEHIEMTEQDKEVTEILGKLESVL